MTNATHLAFPAFNSKGECQSDAIGLTKREYIAAMAPAEIPNWFIHQSQPAPRRPPNWSDIAWENDVDANEVRSWQTDPCFDLSDHLRFFQKEWEAYWENYSHWKANDNADRYFQWRTYYADQLIEALNKGV